MNRLFEKLGPPVLVPALDIDTYLNDGFELVATVCPTSNYTWRFVDINQEVMYSDHRSWVYMIVDGKVVVKVGETGNPLGIRDSEGQPKKGTKCRMGRLRNFGYASESEQDTDGRIRYHLRESVEQGAVKIYALKCEYLQRTQTIAGEPVQVTLTAHKQLELQYLDYIVEETGELPKLNAHRK